MLKSKYVKERTRGNEVLVEVQMVKKLCSVIVFVLRKHSSNLRHKNVIKNNKSIMVINVFIGGEISHHSCPKKKYSAIESKQFFWNECDKMPNVEGKKFEVAIF
jgi:hypothetical protein